MRKKGFFLAILLALTLLSVSAGASDMPEVTVSPSPVPTAAPVINHDFTIEATLGYDGLIVLTRWVPLFVTVTNNGADFEGTVGVNVFLSQTQYDRYEIPLTLAAGATKKVQLPIKPQLRQDMYAVELTQNGEIIAEERITAARLIAPETVTIGVLSDDPQALTYLNQRANNQDTLRGETWLTVPLTVDNFPDTADLLSCFSIIAVDGIDARTLSEEQQQAFKGWLHKGGYVFVSGGAKAAMGYPFFSQWTDLTAGKITVAEDITPALTSYVSIAPKPVGESAWLNEMSASGALIKDGEKGLVKLTRVTEGMIFTTAFDMGGKPLTGWTSMSAFWPRLLRQSIPSQYQTMLNTLENSRYNDPYRANELINALRITNSESALPVFLVLALYLLVVGFGGYLLLKKFDKREWMWGFVPAAAVVFAGLLMLMSGRSDMNNPVALSSSRVLLGKDGAQVSTYIGVATPDSGELTVRTDQAMLPTVVSTEYGGYYYDDNSTDKLYRPQNLRQRYLYGSQPTVGFAAYDAWNAKMLQVESVEADVGGIDARLWMEEDGVHGSITNNSEFLLKDCIVLTSFGYCLPKDILPGQTVDIVMKLTSKGIDHSDPAFKLQPDVMYVPLDVDPASMSTSGYYNDNVSSFMRAAVYGTDNEANYNDPVARSKESMIYLFENSMPMYGASSSYYFFAFNDALGKVAVTINDAPVSRTAHTAVIGSKMEFEPIGPTGIVMFPQGSIPCEIVVDQGEDKKPRVPNETDTQSNGNNNYGTQDTYLQLGSPVSVRFVLPEYETYTLEKMTLTAMSYDVMPTVYLFNNETAEWDSQLLLTVSMDGEDWAPYIDEEGALYVRYVPAESANRYAGMQAPVIALKGKVK